jgi:hypothetical protein
MMHGLEAAPGPKAQGERAPTDCLLSRPYSAASSPARVHVHTALARPPPKVCIDVDHRAAAR